MMLRRAFAAITLGVGLLVGSMLWPIESPASLAPGNLRKMAPTFALADSKGAMVNLADFRGKVVMVDFWATWCHGCKTEIPWYMEFQKKYADRGLSVIGVSMDDDGWKSVKPFLQENKLNYPVVTGNQDLAKEYGVDSMPVTLLVDRDGRIADSHSGVVNKDAFEQEIRMLLREVGNASMK
jgi:peroxiredoxin